MSDQIQNAQRAISSLNQKLDINQIPQGGQELRTILRQTSATLSDLLNSENLHVDRRVQSNLELMRDDFQGMGGAINREETTLQNTENSLGNAAKTATQRAQLADKRQKYNTFRTQNQGAITARHTEYVALCNHTDYFQFNGRIAEAQRTIPLGQQATHNINIHNYLIDINQHANQHPSEYQICDEQGNELEEDNGAYILNIGGQEVRLRGITLPTHGAQGAAQTDIQFNNFRWSPSNIDLPDPLKLSVSAIYNGGANNNGVGNTGINLVNNRKLELHIGARLNDAQRDTVFNRVNVAPNNPNNQNNPHNPNNLPAVRANLINNINNNQAYYTAYSTALANLFPGQREALNTQELKNQFVGHAFTQVNNFQDLRDQGATQQIEDEFRNYITGRAVFEEETDVTIPPAILRDESRLQLRIMQNYMNLIPAFLAFYIQHRLNSTPNDMLQVGSLLQEYVTQKANNTNDDLAGTLLAADDYENNRHKPRNRTNNYMRYLYGAQGSFSEQAVEVDNTTINYGMGVTVSQNGMIEVAVAMENTMPTPGAGADAPEHTECLEIPPVKAGDAGAIIRAILRNQNIPQGHVRQHVAFNVMKVLIEHMQQQGVEMVGVVDDPNTIPAAGSVSPTNATHSRGIGYAQEFFLESHNGGIRLGHSNSAPGGGQLTNDMTYDENWFTTTGDIRQKRAALERMSRLFTMSMEQFHTHQESGNRARSTLGKRPWRARNMNGMRGTRRWTKLKNWNTKNDFSFSLDAPIQSPDGSKQATVTYDGEKFHVNLTRQTTRGETIQKEFATDDVRKLMNLKHKSFFESTARKLTGHGMGMNGTNPRFFDGLELPMMAATNEAIFNQLRQNTKVSRTNFGFEDPRTGRVYIVDRDGGIGYVSYRQEDDEPRRGGRSPFAWLRRGKRSLTKRNREGHRGQVGGQSRGASNNSTWLARTGRRVGRFMGTRYFNVRDQDLPQGRTMLNTAEQRRGFFQNSDLMEEMQQAFKRRIDKWHWM